MLILSAGNLSLVAGRGEECAIVALRRARRVVSGSVGVHLRRSRSDRSGRTEQMEMGCDAKDGAVLDGRVEATATSPSANTSALGAEMWAD